MKGLLESKQIQYVVNYLKERLYIEQKNKVRLGIIKIIINILFLSEQKLKSVNNIIKFKSTKKMENYML